MCREHADYERAPFADRERTEALGSLLLDDPRVAAWVVEGENELAGFATVSLELSTWDAARYLHLDCLYLRPNYRGEKLGDALMRTAAAFALEHDAVNLQWQTPNRNRHAMRFYRSLGATNTAKERFTMSREACRRLVAGTVVLPPPSPLPEVADRWEPREVTWLGLREVAPWTVKQYGIALRDDHEPARAAAEATTNATLDRVARGPEEHRGLAFTQLHRGRQSWWLLIDAWLHGGMISHHVFFALMDDVTNWRPSPPDGPSFCAWELAVIEFERRAFLTNIFAAGTRVDREAYLAARMSGPC